MPIQKTKNESYACPGAWPWQWFRRCEKKVTKWCYSFSFVQKTGGFLWRTTYQGCENGIKYQYTGWGFNLQLGTTISPVPEMCFDNLLPEVGKC